MRIPIDDSHGQDIARALARANGGYLHTFNRAEQILEIAYIAEKNLRRNDIRVTDRPGAILVAWSGAGANNVLTGAPLKDRMATLVHMVRGHRVWILTHVECRRTSEPPKATIYIREGRRK